MQLFRNYYPFLSDSIQIIRDGMKERDVLKMLKC